MTKLRVFLVDDESVILQSLEFLLELEGFAIAGTAGDLAGAMKFADAAEADVAILDINLNGELVYPAADALMARDIPVIFISGRLTNLPVRFSTTTLIGKPCLPETLIDHIERVTSHTPEKRQTAANTIVDSGIRLPDGLELSPIRLNRHRL